MKRVHGVVDLDRASRFGEDPTGLCEAEAAAAPV